MGACFGKCNIVNMLHNHFWRHMTNYLFFKLIKIVIVVIIFQSKNVGCFMYSSEGTAGIWKPKNSKTCKTILLRQSLQNCVFNSSLCSIGCYLGLSGEAEISDLIFLWKKFESMIIWKIFQSQNVWSFRIFCVRHLECVKLSFSFEFCQGCI